ncbi:DUF5780 domain-containing protein [Selenomonas ruminantium]|uniref:DUF5780 domain-containing protein n=1 Tax=Selenomonas ruminantium TaxID=971 RepID=A0A1I0Y5J3_SELRU|nr:DUF5780 domain-containing protein [Selenomonas ruminantium]SFB08087.1 hypothetical protein SAMN05216587_1104 [Selenomonas ruminantium]
MKLSKLVCSSLLAGTVLISGCGNSAQLSQLQKENQELKSQVEDLQKENKELENKVSMYVPKEQKNKSNSSQSQVSQPVKLAKISFDKSGVTEVSVTLQNVSPKNVDAVEFVILQFDNFGRPAYRFNDSSYGNVTSELTMQGNAAPNGFLKSGWTLFNTEKTTKGKVVIKQVHFADGSVWTNNNFEKEVDEGKASFE